MSPVFTLLLRVKATLVDRTRVRKYSAFGSTCLADSISLIDCYPNGRESSQRFRKVLTNQRRTNIIASLCESTPGTGCISTYRADGTLPGFKRRVRSCRRWQLYKVQVDLRGNLHLGMPLGFRYPRRSLVRPQIQLQLKAKYIRVEEL